MTNNGAALASARQSETQMRPRKSSSCAQDVHVLTSRQQCPRMSPQAHHAAFRSPRVTPHIRSALAKPEGLKPEELEPWERWIYYKEQDEGPSFIVDSCLTPASAFHFNFSILRYPEIVSLYYVICFWYILRL